MLSSPSSEATLCDGQRAPLGSRPSRPGPSTAAPTPASRPSTVTSCYPAAQRRTVALSGWPRGWARGREGDV